MLVDTPDGVPTDNFDVRMFIAAFDGGPGEKDDRGRFARMMFGQTVGIKDIKIDHVRAFARPRRRTRL